MLAALHSVSFQSTRPLRGGTRIVLDVGAASWISIHPPLAGRDSVRLTEMLRLVISIHPPLAGRDSGKIGGRWYYSGDFNPPAPCGAGPRPVYPAEGLSDFNPPAPCGAGPQRCKVFLYRAPFQSTRPLRGGTLVRLMVKDGAAISIHPPLAGRDAAAGFSCRKLAISIHPPLAGRDR